MRITGDDPEGIAQLGNFIDPEAKYPVIVTTSQLLSTGVDAQTCRLIVLDREVGSMTEFKQIVGRGTRVHEDTKKYYFTLIDFRKATNHFADPEFDGEPVQIYEPGEDDPVTPPDDMTPLNEEGEALLPRVPGEDETIVDGYPPPDIGLRHPMSEAPARSGKYYIKGNPVTVLTERVEYLDENGRLVTESLRDYSRKAIRQQYASLGAFLRRWNGEERKEAIIEELAEEGLLLDPLMEEVGKDLDPFDLICHIAFDQPPLTRRERADNVRKRDVFTNYGPQARAVLEALLPSIRTKASSPASTTPRSWRSRRSTRWDTASNSSSNSARARALNRLSTNCKPPLSGSSLTHVRTKHRQIHPRHHAPGCRRRWRCPAALATVLDVLSQDHRRPGPAAGGDAGQLPLAHPGAPSMAHAGRPTRKASPATSYWTSSTLELFPSAKELTRHRPERQPQPRGARRVRRRLQLHEVRPAHAAGDQQDQQRRLQRPGRAQALRRHLRTTAQRPAKRRQRRRVLHPARSHRLHGGPHRPKAGRDPVSTPPVAPAAFSPAPSATCATAM